MSKKHTNKSGVSQHSGTSAASRAKYAAQAAPHKVEVHPAQQIFGSVVKYITMVSCLISLVAPVFILLFPKANTLNPNLIFSAIFEGKKASEIWTIAGVPFEQGSYWTLFFRDIFTPDGFATFGIALGCSVTAWALIPAVVIFIKKKEYLYSGICIFVFCITMLAMSGIINMAG